MSQWVSAPHPTNQRIPPTLHQHTPRSCPPLIALVKPPHLRDSSCRPPCRCPHPCPCHLFSPQHQSEPARKWNHYWSPLLRFPCLLPKNKPSFGNHCSPVEAGFRLVRRLTALKDGQFLDFPRGPVVKTPSFQCRGHGFNPWSGN